MIIASKQFIKFSAPALGSRGYGISLEDNSTVQMMGTNEIDISGFGEAHGMYAKGGSKIYMTEGSTTKTRIDGNLVR
jgi:hypothetical protein